MIPRLFLPVLSLALAALLSACGTSSAKYVGEQNQKGYAVTRGKIAKIENLTTENLVSLSDGLAMTVTQSPCRVTLLFDGDKIKTFELAKGVIIVHGEEADYILQSQTEGSQPAK